MVVKAGLGLIGIALVSAGSVAVAKPGLLGMMPNYTALSKDHDYSTRESTDYTGKFGGNNKENLVGVYGNKSGEEGNKAWWEWSFKQLKKDKISSGKFSVENAEASKIKVKKPYAKNDQESDKDTALNKVCEAAYKSEPSNVKEKPSSSETTAFDEAHVWTYCSWLGKKPEPKQ